MAVVNILLLTHLLGYVKSPEDKHKLVVDEYASQIVKRICREFLSGKSMYKIAEALNLEGIETPGVYIATRENNENQLAKYREKKPLWSNVAVGRILENEQYTGTMVYNRFKSENVGDKHAKALPEEEWKRVENCHVAIISKEDFEKVAAMRKGNACVGAERKHETHCLTGKMICGNCGHRLSHPMPVARSIIAPSIILIRQMASAISAFLIRLWKRW